MYLMITCDLNDLNVRDDYLLLCFCCCCLLYLSAYDKLLGASLCKVLSMVFAFCFNSCIVIVCP